MDGCSVGGKCYALKQAKRAKHRCVLCYHFKPHFHTERYREPRQRRKPSAIFICSMGELFDRKNGWAMVAPILGVMWDCPQHTFYILTKQPQNAKNYLFFPENAWVGTSVNRKNDLGRIDWLREVTTSHRFVSFEPLYEDLGYVNLHNIDWIIIGGQTNPTITPSREAVTSLVSHADKLVIPIFMKDNLHPLELPEGYYQQSTPAIREVLSK